jgi:hypothetical protein
MNLHRLKALVYACALTLTGLTTASGQIANGLLNYWSFEGNFNDTAGTAVGSSSTKNDNGTPANAAVVTLQSGGPLGQYGQLRGSHIVVPNSDDILAAGESLTISAWFRVNAFTSSWQALIAHGEGSDYRIARRDAGAVMAYAGGTGDIPGGAEGPEVTDGQWHHVVAISEHQVSTRIWVDGALVATGGAPTISNNGSPNLQIGGNPNAGGRDWNGDVDDIAMWDRALTDEEIGELYTKGLAGVPLSQQFVVNTLPTVGPATLTGETVAVTFTDSATSQVDITKPRSMIVDGAAVNPTTIAKDGAVTTLSWTSPTPYDAGSLHTVDVSVTTTTGTAVAASRTFRAPFVSNIVGGSQFDTEHVWTRGNPQLNDAAGSEAVLDDPSTYPVEDQWKGKTTYIHFDDNAGPPMYLDLSRPYPIWDPANGGTGRADHEDFAIRSRGQIFIKQAGRCWFICNSDDGFSLRIDGTEIGNAGNRGRTDSVMSVDLTAGAHDLEFIHWERGGGAGVSVYIHKGVSEEAPPGGEDSYELVQAWLNPADTDGDGMPDVYEVENGLNPAVNDAALDKDGDGLTNLQDFQRGTRADNPDTDNDGYNDRVETGTGTWVSASDTGTNPTDSDTDDDGLLDGVETNTGSFVSAANAGSNPFIQDTDGDGMGDGSEVILGTNPVVAGPVPTVIATGGTFATEHLWTQGNPQLNDAAGAEAAFEAAATYPASDQIVTQARYVHFHDNTARRGSWRSRHPIRSGIRRMGARDSGTGRILPCAAAAKITITTAGTIWFNCNSDDGFSLRINGNEIGNAPNRGRTDTLMSVDLTAGEHDFELVHWERDGGAGVSVLVYRVPTPTQPTQVNADLWQLLEASGGAPGAPLAVTSFAYDAGTTTLNLSFSSAAGATYALEYTTGFQPAGAPTSAAKWNVVPGYGAIAGAPAPRRSPRSTPAPW